MSVHVSLHPAAVASTESPKVSEPVNSGASFRQALSAASEVALPQDAHGSTPRDGDKKQQKKAEQPKDSSAAVVATQMSPVVQPVLPQLTVQPGTPSPSIPVEIADQAGDAQMDATGNTTTPSLVSSASGATGLTLPVTLRPSPIADPILAAPVSDAEPSPAIPGSEPEAAAAPADDQLKPAAAPILATSDNVSATASPMVPVAAGASDPLQASALKASLQAHDGSKEKDQPILAPGDPKAAATPASRPDATMPPVPVPAAIAPAALPVVVNPPAGLDLNAMITPSGSAVDGVETKQQGTKLASTAAKDRTTPDVHGRRKSDDPDGDSQSGSMSEAASAKFSAMTSASFGQGNNAQPDGKNLQQMESMQSVGVPQASNVQTAAHDATTPQTSDAPSIPVPVATPAGADTLTTSALSGARLIQSVHQSEMKLGMNSAEFGNISISTSVTHQVLSAQISVDHSELSRALAVHLPAMEERLGNAYGLQARVEVRDGSSASYSGSSQQSGEGRQGHQSGASKSTMYSSGLTAAAARSTSTPADDVARLDIRI